MDLDAILQSLDEEIDILRQVRALLTDDTAPLKPVTPGRRKVSAAGRARMAAAQKARWAKNAPRL